MSDVRRENGATDRDLSPAPPVTKRPRLDEKTEETSNNITGNCCYFFFKVVTTLCKKINLKEVRNIPPCAAMALGHSDQPNGRKTGLVTY